MSWNARDQWELDLDIYAATTKETNHPATSAVNIQKCSRQHICRVSSRIDRKGVVGNIRNVKKPVFVLMFFVNAAHESGCGRQHFIDVDEDGFLRSKLNALSNDVAKLADCQV